MDFVLTSDLDWASEYCIDDFLSIAHRFAVKSTIFVTHSSAAIDAAARSAKVELGVHPNFLPDSDHGASVCSVMDHVMRIVPGAVAVRSHRYVENAEVLAAFSRYGLMIDSNVCHHLRRGIRAEISAAGLLKLPVFFEDDVHWSGGLDWRFEKYAGDFFDDGLKILNFHPFFVALNIPDADFYLRHKHLIRKLTREQAVELRYRGSGTRTFLLEALQAIAASGHRFISLGELAAKSGYGGRVASAPIERSADAMI